MIERLWSARLGRVLLGAAVGVALAASAAVAPAALAGVTGPGAAPAVDWSTAVVDSNMKRHTPADFGPWGYPQGLFLYAQYLVFQRTHNPAWSLKLMSPTCSSGQPIQPCASSDCTLPANGP